MRGRELVRALWVLPFLSASLFAAPPDSLLHRAAWVRPEVCDGRLVVQNLRAGQARLTQKAENEELPRQLLALECDDEHITLRYEAEDETGSWNLSVIDEREVTLSRITTGAKPTEVVFRQPPTGDVQLTLRDAGGSHEFTARSVWHLLLGGDQRCRESTATLLEGLWPRLNVAARARDARTALLRNAGVAQTAQEERWKRWIEELDHESFSIRQSADYRLREGGRPVVAYLSRLDLTGLEAEPRVRIRRIMADLADDSGDTSQWAALIVESDSLVWLRLLESSHLDQRAQAREKLMTLMQRPVEFDPAADATIREQQTATIREQLTRAE